VRQPSGGAPVSVALPAGANSPPLPDAAHQLIPAYLGQQRWYAGEEAPDPDTVNLEWSRLLWSGPPQQVRLWQAIANVSGVHYQLLIGERPTTDRSDFLHGRESSVLGVVDSETFYDAVLDSELARALLEVSSGGAETAKLARPMATEQSNSSLVFDDRVILKIFRRLHEGVNLDVEVTTRLAEAGFQHVATPLVTWREGGYDLAFGQQFLAGGSEGWALALTSLRDLYNSTADLPSEAGGDFAPEAIRLGRMTAEMHLALAGAFGVEPAGSGRHQWDRLVESIASRLTGAREFIGDGSVEAAAPLIEHLRAVDEPGPYGRVHGDYHLGQVMETDAGWFVLDFEGEPARPLAERMAPASPLKDVSCMLRSFDYAARYALTERPPAEQGSLQERAEAWEARNRQGFLEGYGESSGIHELLPDPACTPAVLIAYELDKALYELDYERAHRPEWVSIPVAAIHRLIDGAGGGDGGADRARRATDGGDDAGD
jgi:maltokinase